MEKEKMETGTLPFGKRVKCGNYYVLKTARTLSRRCTAEWNTSPL